MPHSVMDEVSPSNEAVHGAPGSSNSPSVSSWRPRKLVFTAYSTPSGAANKTPNLRVVVRRPLVARLTKDIVETYHICNPQFKYSEDQNPKRYLTSPSVGVLNDGFDNSNSDLILTVNSVLVNPEATQRRYIVKDVLGQGTFGQVAKCWVPENGEFVAVKIIKNQPAYHQQALVEVSILTTLNRKYDPEDKHHIILRGLALLKDAGIIHCDLKPENILLCTSLRPAEIKIIDFGSACMEDRTVYSYIQSRYYRSPEVLLGYQYTTAIDMWSFGCIVAELFLGLPLFAGASEFDLLQRMIKILGGQPPDYVLKEAKNATKFFKCIGSVYNPENTEASTSGRSIYQALSEEEYEVREHKKATIGKEYFHHRDLEEIVKNYPYRKNLPKEDIIKETQMRLALIDFLRGLVEFDPAKRWSPLQASRHPFVTGETFMSPYQPPPETPRMLVGHQNMKVSHHHPGGGHWFAAGLSPNVAVWNHQVPAAPSYQGVPHGHAQHASSYGSLGSHHGSYNESVAGLGTSYGSHGGDGVMFQYYSPVGPSAMNHLNTAQGGGSSAMMLGSSPDRRRRNMQQQFSHGLGVSPSGGNFAPLPLGTSPSQFTPPSSSSYNQFSPVHGHYGPTSPARGSIQGSPLGKGAVMNRRMGGWGYSSSPQEHSPTQQQQHCRGSEGGSISQAAEEVTSQNMSSSNGPLVHQHSNSNAMSSWKQQPLGRNGVVPASNFHATNSARQSSIRMYQQQQTSASEMAETNIIPDPGDWDPNYSDDLLLQEDGTETGATALAAEFAEMQLSSADIGVRRLNQAAKPGSSSSSSSVNASNHQREGSSSHGGEVGKYASPPADQQQYSIPGHVRPPAAFKPPPHSLPHQYYNNPLSRLGQQQQQQQQYRMNHGMSGQTADWNHSSKGQHPPHHHHNSSSSFISSGGGIHQSPGNSSSLVNGISSSWGGRGGGGYRGGDGLTSIRPSASRGRKDFGRLV